MTEEPSEKKSGDGLLSRFKDRIKAIFKRKKSKENQNQKEAKPTQAEPKKKNGFQALPREKPWAKQKISLEELWALPIIVIIVAAVIVPAMTTQEFFHHGWSESFYVLATLSLFFFLTAEIIVIRLYRRKKIMEKQAYEQHQKDLYNLPGVDQITKEHLARYHHVMWQTYRDGVWIGPTPPTTLAISLIIYATTYVWIMLSLNQLTGWDFLLWKIIGGALIFGTLLFFIKFTTDISNLFVGYRKMRYLKNYQL